MSARSLASIPSTNTLKENNKLLEMISDDPGISESSSRRGFTTGAFPIEQPQTDEPSEMDGSGRIYIDSR
jgi:hypothetical protein